MRTVGVPTLQWRTVKLVIGFQGTHYEGWQSQKKGSAIQEVFERILTRIFKGKTLIIGSSRTDSGVHARGFVAHFRTQSRLSDAEIKTALNFYLPKDILTLSAKTAHSDFHARTHAKSKVYQYDIWNSRTRPLFEEPFVLWHPQKLEVRLMQKAARYLIGRHDFGAFKDKGGETQSSVRTVKKLTLRKSKEKISVAIEADGFLMHMVRVIVGTLIEAGRKRIRPEQVKMILHSKNRSKAGPTVRPQGLSLIRVRY